MRAEAARLRAAAGVRVNDRAILETKRDAFHVLKSRSLEAVVERGVRVRWDYEFLPVALVQVDNLDALDALLAQPEVVSVEPDELLEPHLQESMPLIGQPGAAQLGYRGAGTTVAVLDSGVDYRFNEAFDCVGRLPGQEPCRVRVTVELGRACSGSGASCSTNADCPSGEACQDDGSDLDDSGHGTAVGHTVIAVAPDARLAAIDVTRPDGAYVYSAIVGGLNWSIANRDLYNIVAVNHSIGSRTTYTTYCTISSSRRTAVVEAREADILFIASAGNEGATDGVNNPACYPESVSVGATLDADGVEAGSLVDQMWSASNSASFMTMVAPGCMICTAGLNGGSFCGCGTSVAAPMVAGGVALIRGAFPSSTPDEVVARLVGTGRSIVDARNGLMFRRLDVRTAVVAHTPCTGDCDGSVEVTVDEVIRSVAIAQGAVPLAACPQIDTNGNGSVHISELTSAILSLLDGCFN